MANFINNLKKITIFKIYIIKTSANLCELINEKL